MAPRRGAAKEDTRIGENLLRRLFFYRNFTESLFLFLHGPPIIKNETYQLK